MIENISVMQRMENSYIVFVAYRLHSGDPGPSLTDNAIPDSGGNPTRAGTDKFEISIPSRTITANTTVTHIVLTLSGTGLAFQLQAPVTSDASGVLPAFDPFVTLYRNTDCPEE